MPETKLFRSVNDPCDDNSGCIFAVGEVTANYNYAGVVALWDHHNARNTIHMSEGEALDMVKAILDIIEERRSDQPVWSISTF